VLLTNVGSPDAPTAKAVRPYLAEFLGDPRVIELPQWLWKPVLHGILLNTRPKRSAALYQNIWTEEGSPLVTNLAAQAAGLQALLTSALQDDTLVEYGLRYGSPSIAEAMARLQQAGCTRMLVFPLFPQYSATTTATSFDAVFAELMRWRAMPELRTINDYHRHPLYIEALAQSIEETWEREGRAEKLLFSFHGIPRRYSQMGDPYRSQCLETGRLLGERLGLRDDEYTITFQSRLGPIEWLQPYTDETVEEWGRQGVKSVQALCPGFSADCLETVDEVGREAAHSFHEAGGGSFTYIPALNSRGDHLQALAAIVQQHLW
jgi:ferrochelatase